MARASREKKSAGRRSRKAETQANNAAQGHDQAPQTTPAVKRKRKPVDLEAKLDREIRAVLGDGPEKFSDPRQWRSFRELVRLHMLYPGKYIAFRDHYEREGGSRVLARREVLCTSDTLMGLHKRIEKVAPGERGIHATFEQPRDALPWIM